MAGKNKGQWYLAFKMLFSRDVWLPVVGFAISFAWLLSSFGACLQLYRTLSEPAVIRGESSSFTSDIRQYVTGLNGVQSVTALSETSALMQWEDYSGTVSIYGVEDTYLMQMAEQHRSAEIAFSEGMAYGVLSQSAVSQFKKENDTAGMVSGNGDSEKSSPLVLSEEDLMKDFILGEGATVRLYALLEDMDTASDSTGDNSILETDLLSVSAGMDVSGAGTLSGLYISEQWFERLFSQPNGNFGETQGGDDGTANQSLLINVLHGYQVSAILEKLSGAGISGSSSVTAVLAAMQETSLQRLYMGLIILVCSLCVLIYQEKLWTERHKDFMADIWRFYDSKRAVKRILRRRRYMIFILGAAGSVLWQWLSFVFET